MLPPSLHFQIGFFSLQPHSGTNTFWAGAHRRFVAQKKKGKEWQFLANCHLTTKKRPFNEAPSSTQLTIWAKEEPVLESDLVGSCLKEGSGECEELAGWKRIRQRISVFFEGPWNFFCFLWLGRSLLFSGILEGFLLHFFGGAKLVEYRPPPPSVLLVILPQKQRHRSLIYGGRNGSVSQKGGGKLPFHFWSFSSRVLLLLLLCLNNVRRVSIPRKKRGERDP